MKLIIDIDDKVYDKIKRIDKIHGIAPLNDYEIAIANGVLLPKYHGRLIDENDVVKIYDIDARVWWENALGDIKDKEFVPTIIEAEEGDMEC